MDLDQRLHELKIQSNSEEKKLLSYEQEALIGPGPEILLYKEALELLELSYHLPFIFYIGNLVYE